MITPPKAATDNAGHGSRNLAMEAVRVTESAALAAIGHMGRGDEQRADEAAVQAMQQALTALDIDGTIRIGEANTGLATDARVGNANGPAVDVALMALEGPTIVARGEPNGLSVMAMIEGNGDATGFLNVPDVYMNKIAVGPGLPDGVIDLDADPAATLGNVADAKGVSIDDLVVCVLDRPRHTQLIQAVRETGARVKLIADGDVSGVLATVWLQAGIDIYMGIGGAQQGVLSAAALACVGGQMHGRLVIRNDTDARTVKAAGIADPDQVYTVGDMASGAVTFAATGVTEGPLLKGVTFARGVTVTQSLVLRSDTGTLRFVESHHGFAAAAGRSNV